LFEPGHGARYLPTGHIVYVLGSTLFARSFDLKSVRVTSGAFPIVDQVRPIIAVDSGGAQFAFSPTGTLVYVVGFGAAEVQQLYYFDRSGAGDALKLPPGLYNYPRMSPDGNLLAYQTTDGKQSYIAVYDLKAPGSARLTYGGNDRFPIWSGDGKYVVFQSDRSGAPAVFRQSIDGGGAEQLTKPEPGTSHVPEAWSPKEDVLLVNIANRESTALWMLSMRDRRLIPFADVTSTMIPTNAVFSPDGRWVAYQASDSRTAEGTVYVRPYPPTTERHQIATGGRPLWSHDGTELFYIPGPSQLSAVKITTQPRFSIRDSTSVPRGFGVSGPLSPRMFDMTADGRILGGALPKDGKGGVPAPAAELRVVLNWFEELKAGTLRR
jgi:Tol biopolymer transport system component